MHNARLLQMPNELLRHIATFLPSPEVPCTFKLLCKRTLQALGEHKTIRVSPGVGVPAHAIDWWRQTKASSAGELTIVERRSIILQAAKLEDLRVLRDALTAMGCLVTTDILTDCARSGFLAGCQHLATQPLYEGTFGGEVLEAAAASGNVALVQWVVQRINESGDAPSLAPALHKAVGMGHREIWEELLRISSRYRLEAAAAAALHGHVSLMDQLLGTGPWEGSLYNVVVCAARGCDLPTLQRLFNMYRQQHQQQQEQQPQEEEEDEPEHPRCKMLAAAVCSATPDAHAKAQWLLQQGHPRDVRCSILNELVELPNAAERVGWMRREGVAFLRPHALLGDPLTRAVAEKGHVPLMVALLNCGAVFSSDDMMAAGREGRMAWLQQLRARRVRIPPVAIYGAAEKGHIALVKWLWGALGLGRGSRSAPDDAAEVRANVLSHAAASGNRELMQWLLRVADRKWGVLTWSRAVSSGCASFVGWLQTRRCPWEVGYKCVAMQERGNSRFGVCVPVGDALSSQAGLSACPVGDALESTSACRPVVCMLGAARPHGLCHSSFSCPCRPWPPLLVVSNAGHIRLHLRGEERGHGHAEVAQAAQRALRRLRPLQRGHRRVDGRLLRQPGDGVRLVPRERFPRQLAGPRQRLT